jgi:NTP pyrophosphatase (non-canonical NTP hydrolase)
MQFSELQNEINKNMDRYATQHNVTVDENWAVLKLLEELGEFSQSIIIHRRQSRPEKYLPEAESKEEVAKELADVVGMAIVCAKLFDIDLEQALSKKWIKK